MATLSDGVDSIVRLLLGRRGTGERITIETVDAVNGNGTYGINGTACPTSGTAKLKVGDRVAVAWRGGKPYLILAHQALRAQFGPYAGGESAILEELITAPPTPTATVTDVWFRNDSQVTLLNLRTLLGIPSVHLFGRGWGWDKRHFMVCNDTTSVVYVIAVEGNADTPLGTTPPTCTLEASYDMTALNVNTGTVVYDIGPTLSLVALNTHVTSETLNVGAMLSGALPSTVYIHVEIDKNPAAAYFDHTFAGKTGFASGLDVITHSLTSQDAFLNEANEPVVTFSLALSYRNNATLQTTFGTYSLPIVVNVATGQVVYNGLSNYGEFPTPGLVQSPLSYDATLQVATAHYYGQAIAFTALSDKTGKWVASIIGTRYQDQNPFVELPQQTSRYIALAASGVEVFILDSMHVNDPPFFLGATSEFYTLLTYSDRHALWGVGKLPTGDFTSATMPAIRMVDFISYEDATIAVADPTGMAFLRYLPQLIAPSLMLALNPTPTEFAKADAEPELVDFLGDKKGATITIREKPTKLSGSETAAAMAQYDDTSAHILAGFKTTLTENHTYIGVQQVLSSVRYQALEAQNSSIQFAS